MHPLRPHPLILASLVAAVVPVADLAAQPRMLADVNTFGSSDVSFFVTAGQQTFFDAGNWLGQRRLYRTDGTSQGTYAVRTDMSPSPMNSLIEGTVTALPFQGACYFVATDPAAGQELWRSDGTAGGTTLVADLNPGAAGGVIWLLGELNGELLFCGTAPGVTGRELFKTDGTAAGTGLLADLDPVGFGDPVGFVVAGGRGFFRARTNASGTELWTTDGTAAGTRVVRELGAGSASGLTPTTSRQHWHLVPLGNEVFFTGWTGSNSTDRRLWKSDGTAAGTVVVSTAAGLPLNAAPLGVVNGELVLTGQSTASGPFELWKTDGTGAGMVRITSSLGGTPGCFVDLGDGRAFFAGQTASTGVEPAVTDGTAAGTRMLADVWAGSSNGITIANPHLPIAARVGDGHLVVFRGQDANNDVEPWISDGTPAGTRRAVDLWPGNSSSAAIGFTAGAGRRTLFFRAADGAANGDEPWALDAEWLGGTIVEEFGGGCGGVNGVPHLYAFGAPTLGNPTFALRLEDAAPNAPASLVVGTQQGMQFLGPCPLHVAFPWIPITLATDALGGIDLTLAIPATPSMLGTEAYFQVFVGDAQGAYLNLASASNGLRLVFGL